MRWRKAVFASLSVHALALSVVLATGVGAATRADESPPVGYLTTVAAVTPNEPPPKLRSPSAARPGIATAAASPKLRPRSSPERRAQEPPTPASRAPTTPASEPRPEVPAPLSEATAAAFETPSAVTVSTGPVEPGAWPGSEGTASTERSGPGDDVGGGGPGLAAAGRGRRHELFARVIGGGTARAARALDGRPYVSLKEATGLRTHDFFPRLPAALWTARGPYVVVIDLCVDDDGTVSEASLVSEAAPHLDRLVLDAVRTWRYQPRIVKGRAAGFCHDVVIQYTSP